MAPGIHEANAAIFKIGNVAGGKQCTMHTCDGSDLGVHFGDRLPLTATVCRDLRKCPCRLFIESENVPGEVFREHSFGLGTQLVAPFPGGQGQK